MARKSSAILMISIISSPSSDFLASTSICTTGENTDSDLKSSLAVFDQSHKKLLLEFSGLLDWSALVQIITFSIFTRTGKDNYSILFAVYCTCIKHNVIFSPSAGVTTFNFQLSSLRWTVITPCLNIKLIVPLLRTGPCLT